MAALLHVDPINLNLTTSLVQLVAAPPSGWIENLSIRASLYTGTADALVSLWLEEDAGSNDGYIVQLEPVRVGVSGGAIDLLIDYQLYAGYSLQAKANITSIANLHVYNRVRKKIA